MTDQLLTRPRDSPTGLEAEVVRPPARRRPTTTTLVVSALVLCAVVIGGALAFLRADDDSTALGSGGSSPPVEAFGADPVIVLDAFSGRPNPQWVLRPGEFEQLVDAIAALPTSADGLLDEPTLGFRGINLVSTDAGDAAPTVVSLDGTHVVVERPGEGPVVLDDPQGEVMRLASNLIASHTTDPAQVELLQPWLR